MSDADRRNIALAREGFEAFARGDFSASLAVIHPEVEWRVAFRIPDLPIDRDVYHGRDEVRALWEAFAGGWERLTIAIEEVIAAADPWIVLRTRFFARAQASGLELDQAVFYACRIEDGLLRQIHPFETEAAALADAGIERDGVDD